MGKSPSGSHTQEELTLTVDDRGRVTLPKEVRDRLGIESNDEIPATLVGSVLELEIGDSNSRSGELGEHDPN